MKSMIAWTVVFAALSAAAPLASLQDAQPVGGIERRDGETEFDPDFALKRDTDNVARRDGETEFDPDFALKRAAVHNKRDGETEFDPDFALKREVNAKRDGETEFDPDFALKKKMV